MSDILCIYYSRTGHTRRAVKEIAEALGAEITAITDDCDRSGWRGYMRCGMDAMKTSTRPLQPFETEKPLGAYKLVIVGQPGVGGAVRQPHSCAAEAAGTGDGKRGLCGHAEHHPAQRGGL